MVWCMDGGHNKYGQTGCVNEEIEIDQVENTDKNILKPTQLKGFDSNIKSIYCSSNQSFALTANGRVYSWGYNNWCQLGHDLCPKNAKLFETHSNIKHIGALNLLDSRIKIHIYLQMKDSFIFVVKSLDRMTVSPIKRYPKYSKTKEGSVLLQSITCYHKNQLIATAVS